MAVVECYLTAAISEERCRSLSISHIALTALAIRLPVGWPVPKSINWSGID